MHYALVSLRSLSRHIDVHRTPFHMHIWFYRFFSHLLFSLSAMFRSFLPFQIIVCMLHLFFSSANGVMNQIGNFYWIFPIKFYLFWTSHSVLFWYNFVFRKKFMKTITRNRSFVMKMYTNPMGLWEMIEDGQFFRLKRRVDALNAFDSLSFW